MLSVFFSIGGNRSRGMFSFGKSRHLILVTKINVLKISGDSTKSSARMKYTVCYGYSYSGSKIKATAIT